MPQRRDRAGSAHAKNYRAPRRRAILPGTEAPVGQLGPSASAELATFAAPLETAASAMFAPTLPGASAPPITFEPLGTFAPAELAAFELSIVFVPGVAFALAAPTLPGTHVPFASFASDDVLPFLILALWSDFVLSWYCSTKSDLRERHARNMHNLSSPFQVRNVRNHIHKEPL